MRRFRETERVSDQQRERVVAELNAGCAAGLLSVDTLTQRVERALRAKSRGELDSATIDLPSGRGRLAALALSARQLAGRGALPVELPERAPVGATLRIGRHRGCDLTLAHETVSRRHAALTRGPGGWTVRDVGSLNGTWLNGWRLQRETAVEPGDELQLGGVLLRLRRPRRRLLPKRFS